MSENNGKISSTELALALLSYYNETPWGKRAQAIKEELEKDESFQALYREAEEKAGRAVSGKSDDLKAFRLIKEKIAADPRIQELESIRRETRFLLEPLEKALDRLPGKELERYMTGD